ncbi:SIR2 family protein [Herbaspirillum huttiense F1]|nr:SIR2 family protein [Herbaspirillum huttiense F1]
MQGSVGSTAGDIPRLTIDAFVRSISVNRNRPTIILLGAGASITSGMPSAQRCIWEWKKEIFVTKNPSLQDSVSELSLQGTKKIIQRWLDQSGLYPPEGAPEEYSFYALECYPTALDRSAFFHKFIAESKPHVGYQLLALLGGAGAVRSIWTTNFDNLAARSLSAANVVCVEVGIDTQQRTSRAHGNNEVRLLALHGDFRYDKLKNTNDELRAQETWLGTELIREIQNYDLIVVGYSGRDQSLMDVLGQAYRTSERRLYWCGFGDEPSEEVKILLRTIPAEKQSAFYIASAGFDDLISRLAMRQLEGDDLTKAQALIASTGQDGVRKMAFSVPPLQISHLIKSNAHPLRYPASALKLPLYMPEVGSWKDWLREQTPNEAGPTVVFDKGALCLCDAPLAQRLFAHHLNGPATEVAISDENLISDGRILGLYRRALVIAAARATGMQTDCRRRIWEAAPYDQKMADKVSYKVHRALSIDIVGIDGVPHVVFMPEIVATTLEGKIADVEPTKALRNQIYGYQHNNVFDADLSRWTGQLVSLDLPSPHGGIFHIARAPLFAGLSNKAAKTLPAEFSKYAKQWGIVVPDAPLIFASKMGRHEIKNPNPLHGLVENRPWDHSLTSSGFCQSTDVAVVCPANLAGNFEQFLHGLEQPANPSQSERDYLHDYPGYTAAFGLPLRTPCRGESAWLALDDNVSSDAMVGAKQLAQRICQTLDLIRRARQSVTVVIYVPRRWEPYKLVSKAHESFNLHDYVKAYAARHGQSTQLVREETTGSASLCRVRWWLALALFVKSMRTPWRLDALDEDTAFVGIGYSLDKDAHNDSHVLLGCSHLYSARGEGLQFRLGRIENPIIKGGNPFMSQDDARRTGDTIRQLFYESKMHLPRRVVIHKRTRFTQDEQEGLLQGLEGVPNVELIEINVERSLRYLASKLKDGKLGIDGFPVQRGTTVVESDDTALLWVHGSTPSAANKYYKYYQGKRRIPAPLRIRRFMGQSDVMQCATEILGLSKMNWNTLDYYSRMPATLDSAGSIAKFGKYLDGFTAAPYDYRLLI